MRSSEFAWTCTCGEGGAAWAPTRALAREAGEVHRCRAGRLREAHAIVVVERGSASAA